MGSMEALARLRAYVCIKDDYNIAKRAAVLIPLMVAENDDILVLLTLRSKHLRSHAGEVSFPGGKVDKDDASLVYTALRESKEEISLEFEMVDYLGLLAPALIKSDILVTPVMGLIRDPNFKPIPNLDEVRSFVSNKRFLMTDGYAYMDSQVLDNIHRHHIFDWAGYPSIFGFTAVMCIQTAMLAYDQYPAFKLRAPGQPNHHNLIKLAELAMGKHKLLNKLPRKALL